MLADQDGTLHIVTGTDQAEQTFERAERDLREGTLASTPSPSPRWCGPATCGPTRGAAAGARQPGPTRSAGPVGPVIQEGRPIGTCNALTTSPKTWADNDIGAIRTYAEMLAQLVGSVADPRHKGELAAQLQFALESRVLIEQAKRRPDRPPRLGDETSFELAALTLPTTGSAVGPRCRGLMQAANPMTPRPGSSMGDQR